ncbi:MAG: hypothetical protein QFB87_04035 [Patescibacteria group bacterium]|nr:hypothetical protein [Patescibacteria group bacterium]
MTNPELSLPPTSVREQFLDLAALICRQEFQVITTRDNGLTYNWIPESQQAFTEPLALKSIAWTSHPQWNNNFKIVEATFCILGDNEMDFGVSRDFHDREKFDETLNDDPLADLVLGLYKKSYLEHRHHICLQSVKNKKEVQGTTKPAVKITDKRRVTL